MTRPLSPKIKANKDQSPELRPTKSQILWDCQVFTLHEGPHDLLTLMKTTDKFSRGGQNHQVHHSPDEQPQDLTETTATPLLWTSIVSLTTSLARGRLRTPQEQLTGGGCGYSDKHLDYLRTTTWTLGRRKWMKPSRFGAKRV